jgi:hypothetical protein
MNTVLAATLAGSTTPRVPVRVTTPKVNSGGGSTIHIYNFYPMHHGELNMSGVIILLVILAILGVAVYCFSRK